MHEENRHADEGDSHQHNPRQMGFYPIHGKQWTTGCGVFRRAQARFIGDVIHRVKAGRREQRLQQDFRRSDAHIKAEHEDAGQREAKEKGQQKQQREEYVEVKTYAPEFKPGERGDKQRAQQPDHQQAAKLQLAHALSPEAIRSARCHGVR